MSGFIYLAINSEENGVLQKTEKSVQVSLKAVNHIAFVGIKLKEEQLVQLLNGVFFFKNVCYKNRLHICKTKGHISELYYFGSILTLSAVVWEYLLHCVRSHLEKPIPWYFTAFYYGIKYQSYIRKQSNYFVKSCIPQFTMPNTYFHVFVVTKASLYQVTCKGKVLHSTFKHRKLKIRPQKYTWHVGYKVYFQFKNHNKIFCYTLLILIQE